MSYLLAGTGVFGGVKVVLHQASLLARRGHIVTVVSPEPPPSWYPLTARFCQVPHLVREEIPPSDLTVATFWTTLEPAVASPCRQALHFCQGYEASFPHNPDEHPVIEAAYRHPLPAMVVAPHLAEILRQRYGRPSRLVPQALEAHWRPRLRWRPSHRPRILVMSPFEIVLKGVEVALRAVHHLREEGFDCRLVRITQWPPPQEELDLFAPDELHLRLSPQEVGRVMQSCDLLLAPSWPQEGFGLPVLEALASGLPVVASDIPSYRYFAAGAARLVAHDQPEAFALAAREVLERPGMWRRMRRSGRRRARAFSEARAVEQVEATCRWALSGAWKNERLQAEALSPGTARGPLRRA